MVKTIQACILSFAVITLMACGEGPQTADTSAVTAVLKPDLVAEIISGKACPVNSGETVKFRVKNIGNANSPVSALRIKIRIQGAVSYWYTIKDVTIGGLTPGQTTTIGTTNSTGQVETLAFFNGTTPGVRVTSWSIMVDDSGSAQESNELNNLLNNAGQCFPG